METELLRALRSTIRADSDPGRQAQFGDLRRASRAAAVALRLYRALGRSKASTLFVSLYGLKSHLLVAAPSGGAGLMAVSVHANARRQVHRLASWFEPGRVHHLEIGLPATRGTRLIKSGLRLASAWRGTRRHLRVIHRIERRRDFLVSCRASGLLATYGRAREILSDGRWTAVIVSSDTNPEEVAFAAAARTLGVPSVFIAHTYPNPFAPPLRFSLSLLEGEAAADARRRQGPIVGDVVLLGLEGASRPVDAQRFNRPHPVIGVCTPKTVDWPRLADLINDCRSRHGARQVLVRWHPSMIESPRLDAVLPDMTNVIETSPTESIRAVVDRCDWIVADPNSNVHLDALRIGVPTVALRKLGITQAGREDVFGFVAAGILYPPVNSLQELSTSDIIEFFERDWERRYQRFDAAYLCPPGSRDREAKDAIERLVSSPTPFRPQGNRR
jgi:hypothetical protein